MQQILVLAIGSFAGGFARFWLSGAVFRAFGSNFPYGTLFVNAVGCFLIGF
jgi:fluoride exporter